MDDRTGGEAPAEEPVETPVDAAADAIIDSVLFLLPEFVKQMEALGDDVVIKEPEEFTYGVAMGMIGSMLAAKAMESGDPAAEQSGFYAVLSERLPKIRKAIFD